MSSANAERIKLSAAGEIAGLSFARTTNGQYLAGDDVVEARVQAVRAILDRYYPNQPQEETAPSPLEIEADAIARRIGERAINLVKYVLNDEGRMNHSDEVEISSFAAYVKEDLQPLIQATIDRKEPTSDPITIEQAVEILNERGYEGYCDWQARGTRVFGVADRWLRDEDAIAIARSLIQATRVAELEGDLKHIRKTLEAVLSDAGVAMPVALSAREAVRTVVTIWQKQADRIAELEQRICDFQAAALIDVGV